MQPQGQKLDNCVFNFFTNSYICVYVTLADIVLITVAAWYKVHMVLDHSRAQILLRAWLYVCIFLCCVACVGRGLVREQFSVQGDITKFV
jgi:hypothetical protein